MSKTNKVACFYTALKNNAGTVAFTEQCYPMIDYWSKSWQKNGWETFVLTEEDIEKDDDYFALKFDRFEKSNLCKYTIDWDCEYSRACYLRWLAYHQFAKKHGDIFWCDYDIIIMDSVHIIKFYQIMRLYPVIQQVEWSILLVKRL